VTERLAEVLFSENLDSILLSSQQQLLLGEHNRQKEAGGMKRRKSPRRRVSLKKLLRRFRTDIEWTAVFQNCR